MSAKRACQLGVVLPRRVLHRGVIGGIACVYVGASGKQRFSNGGKLTLNLRLIAVYEGKRMQRRLPVVVGRVRIRAGVKQLLRRRDSKSPGGRC